jgi:hypothetical protein
MARKQENKKTRLQIYVKNDKQLEHMIESRDVRFTEVVCESILSSKDGRPESITMNFEDGSYAIMDFADNKEEDLRLSMQESIKDLEKAEKYELCARIQDYLNKTK